ncbi:putative hemolysin [Neomegalonema perideroedes]|uniref:putative hemolysin n=1 Tax=Neomegalonema perideroedes TaxID=217219 RepID=UPI000370DE63|nr:DUF333 domain-containing protein [Neomegalonema perideroedes]
MTPARLTLLLVAPVLLAACASRSSSSSDYSDAPPPMAGMGNPASIYCESAEMRGVLSIRRTPDGGGEYGVCMLPDGSEMEEWALFRRDHPQ